MEPHLISLRVRRLQLAQILQASWPEDELAGDADGDIGLESMQGYAAEHGPM